MAFNGKGPGRMYFSIDAGDVLVGDVAKAFDMSRALSAEAVIDLYLQGKKLMKIQISAKIDDFESHSFTEEVVSDLVYLEQQLPSTQFSLPAEVNKWDRIIIRVARLLLARLRHCAATGNTFQRGPFGKGR